MQGGHVHSGLTTEIGRERSSFGSYLMF